jgi:DNA polymerase I-like protein with 3'-5' exonuclease and polymerase domains
MPTTTTTTTKLPTNNLLFVDVESQNLDAKWNKDIPLYMVCTLCVEEDNKKLQAFSGEELDKALSFIQEKTNEGFTLIAHNIKFDYSVLKLRGLKLKRNALRLCTQLMAFLKDPTLPSYSLDSLTGEKQNLLEELDKLGVWNDNCPRPKNTEEFWKKDWHQHKEVLETMKAYCFQDLRATYSLYKKLSGWYNKNHPELIETLLKLELPMVEVLSHLETRGFNVNNERLSCLKQKLEQEMEEANKQIKQKYPLLPKLYWCSEEGTYKPVEMIFKKGKNKNKSYAQLYTDNEGHVVASDPYTCYDHCRLYEYNSAAATGHTWWILKKEAPDILAKAKTTSTGKPALNKEFFKEIADYLPDDLPFAKLIKLSKYLTMCEGLTEFVGTDGRIHCDFFQTGTRTSRLATRNPNLQNMPRPYDDKHPDYRTDNDFGMKFRQLFTGEPGKTMLVADLDRIEVVVLAWFLAKCCGDYNLLHTCNQGLDVHGENAKMWGIPRSVAKSVLFMLIYGGSPQRMLSMGVVPTLEEAEKVFAAVETSQPAIPKLKQMVWNKARKRWEKEGTAYITNPFGGRGIYNELVSDKEWEVSRGERQAFNWLIQKTARDVLHFLLIQSLPIIEEHGATLSNVIHDEAVVECPQEKAEELKQKLNQVWNSRFDILPGVRIHGEWNIGESWFEAK